MQLLWVGEAGWPTAVLRSTVTPTYLEARKYTVIL